MTDYRTSTEILDLAKEIEELAVQAAVSKLGAKVSGPHGAQTHGATPADRAGFEQQFAGIASYFEPFLKPNPTSLDALITEVKATGKKLQAPVYHDLANLNSELTNTWQGLGGNEFIDTYAARFPVIHGNLQKLNEALEVAIQGARNLYAASRNDVYDIGVKTKTALLSIIQGGQTNHAVAFAILSIIGGFGTAIPTIGMALGRGAMKNWKGKNEAGHDRFKDSVDNFSASATTFTLVGAQGANIRTVQGKKAPTAPEISGGDPQTVISKMSQALSALRTSLTGEEDKVIKAIQENQGKVAQARQQHALVPPRPRILGVTDPGRMKQEIFPTPKNELPN